MHLFEILQVGAYTADSIAHVPFHDVLYEIVLRLLWYIVLSYERECFIAHKFKNKAGQENIQGICHYQIKHVNMNMQKSCAFELRSKNIHLCFRFTWVCFYNLINKGN